MPELPEVETVRLQLLYRVAGKTIATVTTFHPRTVNNNKNISEQLSGKTIATINRVGKLLIFEFKDETTIFLLAHLKMTGQFFYVDTQGKIAGGGHSLAAADSYNLPNRHTRSSFHFTDGSTLYFNDMRIFGYTKTASTSEVAYARTTYGPEPIHETFDVEWFATALRRKSAIVKATLLDQSFIAGLGNIYVDEALWWAKVRPTRRANKVTKAEARLIAKYAGQVMNDSIKVGGTTFQHFVDVEGNKRNYTKELRVFGKQNTPCPRCGATIKKVRAAGRGTHYCPGCQK